MVSVVGHLQLVVLGPHRLGGSILFVSVCIGESEVGGFQGSPNLNHR